MFKSFLILAKGQDQSIIAISNTHTLTSIEDIHLATMEDNYLLVYGIFNFLHAR